jgi:predicted TIM-barrel fold metal-dependent hydrolase
MGETRALLISADGHVGPSLRNDLRPYCDAEYLDEFDAYADEMDAMRAEVLKDPAHVDFELLKARERTDLVRLAARIMTPGQSDIARKAYKQIYAIEGLRDPTARARDMDAEGIAADVIFAGGQNGELLPFVGFGLSVGPDALRPDLQVQACKIFNRWLADFCNANPGRHIGCMQVPMFDVDETIRMMHEFREKGLKAVNFPGSRSSFTPYNDPRYEPLWHAAEELDLPLCNHAGGGEEPLGAGGPGGMSIQFHEAFWLARRSMWQLIFGGVFERHPHLKLAFTEQGAGWVRDELNNLDSVFHCQLGIVDKGLTPRPPSEYFAENCFLVASFPAQYEIARRDEVGVSRLLWGADYPHYEGTFPRTQATIRHAFAGVPEQEMLRILGGNALGVFDLDARQMAAIASRIGPTVSELTRPLDALPDHRGLAFRTIGNWS